MGASATRTGQQARATVHPKRSVGIDPRTPSSMNDSDDDWEDRAPERDADSVPTSSLYRTACDKTLSGFSTALDTTRDAFAPIASTSRIPCASSTRKRFRWEEDLDTQIGNDPAHKQPTIEEPAQSSALSPAEEKDKRFRGSHLRSYGQGPWAPDSQ